MSQTADVEKLASLVGLVFQNNQAQGTVSIETLKNTIKTVTKYLKADSISYSQALQVLAVGMGYKTYEDALNHATVDDAGVKHLPIPEGLDTKAMVAKAEDLVTRDTAVSSKITNPASIMLVKNQIFNAIIRVLDSGGVGTGTKLYDDTFMILLHPKTEGGKNAEHTSKAEDFYIAHYKEDAPEGMTNVDSKIYHAIHEIDFKHGVTLMKAYQCMELFFCTSLPYCGHVVVLVSGEESDDETLWTVHQFAFVVEISLGEVKKVRAVDLCTMETTQLTTTSKV